MAYKTAETENLVEMSDLIKRRTGSDESLARIVEEASAEERASTVFQKALSGSLYIAAAASSAISHALDEIIGDMKRNDAIIDAAMRVARSHLDGSDITAIKLSFCYMLACIDAKEKTDMFDRWLVDFARTAGRAGKITVDAVGGTEMPPDIASLETGVLLPGHLDCVDGIRSAAIIESLGLLLVHYGCDLPGVQRVLMSLRDSSIHYGLVAETWE
jgi:hypothetical protein